MSNKIQLAAKLYDVRDHVKRELGDAYTERMAEGGKLLTGIANARDCGVLEAALYVTRSAEGVGNANQVALILAAAVELLEPSEVQA